MENHDKPDAILELNAPSLGITKLSLRVRLTYSRLLVGVRDGVLSLLSLSLCSFPFFADSEDFALHAFQGRTNASIVTTADNEEKLLSFRTVHQNKIVSQQVCCCALFRHSAVCFFRATLKHPVSQQFFVEAGVASVNKRFAMVNGELECRLVDLLGGMSPLQVVSVCFFFLFHIHSWPSHTCPPAADSTASVRPFRGRVSSLPTVGSNPDGDYQSG